MAPGPGRPWVDRHAVRSRHSGRGGQNGRCAERCSTRRYLRSACRREPAGARALAMMAACPARRDPPDPDVRAPIELPHRSGEALPIYQPHGPREECGVVGVWWPGAPGRAHDVRRAACAPAPRPGVGRDRRQRRLAADACTSASGWSSGVFDEETLHRLDGGDDRPRRHRRRSATRATARPARTPLPNVQPVYVETDRGELMLGHNGNLTNARWLRDELGEQGVEFASASDTEVLAEAHRPRAGADVGPARRPRLPPRHRRLHVHDAHRRRAGRRARPGRLPAAGPRPAAAAGDGRSPRRARRSTRWARSSCATSRPARC